jgi:hypothetical protein
VNARALAGMAVTVLVAVVAFALLVGRWAAQGAGFG